MMTLLSNAFTAFTPRSSSWARPWIALEGAATQASAAVRSSPDWFISPSPSPTQVSSSEKARTTRARHRLLGSRSRVNSRNRRRSAKVIYPCNAVQQLPQVLSEYGGEAVVRDPLRHREQ